MPAYMISYDLRKVRNYDALIKQLRDWQCISPLKSVWLGLLNGPATALRDLLLAHIDNDDGLLVMELKQGCQWGSYLLNENGADWLSRNVTKATT